MIHCVKWLWNSGSDSYEISDQMVMRYRFRWLWNNGSNGYEIVGQMAMKYWIRWLWDTGSDGYEILGQMAENFMPYKCQLIETDHTVHLTGQSVYDMTGLLAWLGPRHCLKESQPTENGRRNCHHWGQDGCFCCPVETSADAVGPIWPRCECKNKRRDTNCLRSVCKQPAVLMLKAKVTKTCLPGDKNMFAKWQRHICQEGLWRAGKAILTQPLNNPTLTHPTHKKGFYTLDVSEHL